MKNSLVLPAIALLGGALFTIASADAAGPFDGQYTGGSPNSGGRTGCSATIATVTIADGKISGKYTERNYTFNISGTVAADGSVKMSWGGHPVSGTLAGGKFDGTYSSKECGTARPISLNKSG